MKQLTKEEFQDRLVALNRAKRIFNNLTDNNITKSFEAYQAILAETERPLTIPIGSTDSQVYANTNKNVPYVTSDHLCPLCNKALLKYDPCCGNPNGYLSCCDPVCGYKETL